jgi:hypothetical protein
MDVQRLRDPVTMIKGLAYPIVIMTSCFIIGMVAAKGVWGRLERYVVAGQ